MACRLVGAKPLSKPMRGFYCQLDPWELQWNFNRNLYIFIQENAFENVVWKMAAILSLPQCIYEIIIKMHKFSFKTLLLQMSFVHNTTSFKAQMSIILIPYFFYQNVNSLLAYSVSSAEYSASKCKSINLKGNREFLWLFMRILSLTIAPWQMTFSINRGIAISGR